MLNIAAVLSGNVELAVCYGMEQRKMMDTLYRRDANIKEK